ncbi:hypothetical protein S83_016366, partial [Arachis hypogaea]
SSPARRPSSQQLQPEFVRHSPLRRSSRLLVAYCLQVISRESPPSVSLFSALLILPSLQGLAVQPSTTLLDPVFLSTCLAKPLIAVTYSLSKVSEFIAPIRIVKLTRDRKQDCDLVCGKQVTWHMFYGTTAAGLKCLDPSSSS